MLRTQSAAIRAHRASGFGDRHGEAIKLCRGWPMRRWTVVVLGRLGAAAHRRGSGTVAGGGGELPECELQASEREIGVDSSTDFITGALYTALRNKLNAVAPGVANVDPPVKEAPLAIQGHPPASGLFSFDKYSSAPILIVAFREAAGNPVGRGGYFSCREHAWSGCRRLVESCRLWRSILTASVNSF